MIEGRAPLAPALLDWFARHGRRDLPWQHPATPYRVWVSEVMLQQTRVGVVIPYFERFMAAFPDVAALAHAPLDAVLAHWSGLGYYARARNLHRAAGLVCARHGGALPEDVAALQALPGIGRSTAGAILALAGGARHPILDGNVKRVLARYHGVAGWPGEAAVARRLWALAAAHTPREGVREYTQAVMDLGASLCARRNPGCERCPLAAGCAALSEGSQERLPAPRPRRRLETRRRAFLILRQPSGEVLLERRPPAGIWGGLWSLPEAAPDTDPVAWCLAHVGQAPARVEAWAPHLHTFTHFRLELRPLLLQLGSPCTRVLDGDGSLWYKPGLPSTHGVAAPVARLLARLTAPEETDDDPHGALREARP